MARKLPDPSERSEKEPAVLCGSERVLSLYNTANNKNAQRVSKEVRSWFIETAQEEGWDSAIFIKHVETAILRDASYIRSRRMFLLMCSFREMTTTNLVHSAPH
jgi:hypothetical protein